MSDKEVIEKTANYIKNKFANEGSGHDWFHIYRVWQNALVIGKTEEADMFVVQLASLLHDIADFKAHDGDTEAGPKAARRWLEKQRVEEKVVDHVCDVIRHLSFKGAGAEEKMKTIEGKIVRDADRLDAIGAIGIARCFAYGGYKGNPLHDPEIKPKPHNTKEEYLKGWEGKSTQINHFYEKLLLLKDLMLTKTGRKMAEGRHLFMEKYLKQFLEEWDGRK